MRHYSEYGFQKGEGMRFIQIRLVNEGTSRARPVATRKLDCDAVRLRHICRSRLIPLIRQLSGHLSEMPTLRLRAFHKLVLERHFPRTSAQKFFEENNLVLRLPRLCRLDWHE